MNHPSKLAVLIIAAGLSSRMNDFKPLLPFKSANALLTLIRTYQVHGVKDIYVVTGYRCEEIKNALKDELVRIVYNEEYEKGMFSSIQKGLRAMEGVDAFYMQPVDIPLIKRSSLDRLREAYECAHKGVIYPLFLGRKGHPPLIDMKYKEQILLSDGEGGLKKVLEAFDEDSLHVNVSDKSVLMDMDTPKDYQNLVAYEALMAPTKEECLAIMLENKVPTHIIKHCETVEAMASEIYESIASFGLLIDKPTLSAAALLHDIARLEKEHASVGAQKIRALGYALIGDMIKTHMDIDVDETAPLSANELLFLADKLVGEEKVCGLEKRFDKALKKCEGNEEALKHMEKRLLSARRIITKIETLTCKDFPYG